MERDFYDSLVSPSNTPHVLLAFALVLVTACGPSPAPVTDRLKRPPIAPKNAPGPVAPTTTAPPPKANLTDKSRDATHPVPLKATSHKPQPEKPQHRQPTAQAAPTQRATTILSVLVGAVRRHEATVAIRLNGVGKTRIHYWAKGTQKRIWSQTMTTAEGDGFSVHFPLVNLKADTTYQYQAEIVGQNIKGRVGQFQVAPTVDRRRRIAFSADISTSRYFYTVIDDLIASNPSLYVSLGDWPYADRGLSAWTVEDYRRKHQNARDPDLLKKLMRQMAIHAVWDDHEMLNDWDAGLTNKYPDRIADGIKVWHEFFPVKGAPKGEIYRSHQWGPGLEIFYLDTRSHRDANQAPQTAQKTLLGKAQKAWFLQALTASKATFKLVVTSVPLYFGTSGNGLDHWSGFPAERRTILDTIVQKKIPGVVFISGDQHWFAVHHLPRGLKEFQVGPLAQYPRPPKRHTPPWVVTQQPVLNFVTVDYLPGKPAELVVTAWTDGAIKLYEERFTAEMGRIHIHADIDVHWHLSGPHTFVGNGTTRISWAPAGRYTIQWLSSDGMGRGLPQHGTLWPDGTLRLHRAVPLIDRADKGDPLSPAGRPR
jgi:hypothetical protein